MEDTSQLENVGRLSYVLFYFFNFGLASLRLRHELATGEARLVFDENIITSEFDGLEAAVVGTIDARTLIIC